MSDEMDKQGGDAATFTNGLERPYSRLLVVIRLPEGWWTERWFADTPTGWQEAQELVARKYGLEPDFETRIIRIQQVADLTTEWRAAE